MKKNALYIHGFMGNPEGGTFKTLKKTLKNWNIHSISFPDLHTDVKKTQRLISDYCKSKKIEMLIGASLGAFYVLQYKDTIDKLVINPCLYPSIEIPKLKDRATGNPIILSNKVLSDFREMEKYENIPEEQKKRTFGIFAKDDELFHFKESFDKLFCYKECYYPNSILINGHYSIEEEFLTDGLQQAEKYFEDRAMTRAAVEIIYQLIKSKKKAEEKAKVFNVDLPALTETVLKEVSEDEYYSYAKALRELFDSFAIIDEFDNMLIVDCFNIIKICLQKYNRFGNKELPYSSDFEELLNHFYSIMEDLYYYEIFGFFSTTVHPEDIPELNLPCKVFCGCTSGWEKEPYLEDDGSESYENVIRFRDPLTKELFCMTIGYKPRVLENREKCSLTDEQLDIIRNFVRVNKGIILLHSAGIIDSPTFHAALRVKANPVSYVPKYRIVYTYVQYLGNSDTVIPSKKYYVDMDDMSYEEAVKNYAQLKKELQQSLNAGKEDCDVKDFDILRPDEGKNFCCFCNTVFDGNGNSTWPIYYKEAGETHRCCDECNEKYVIAAREDNSLVMKFRKQFGVDYTEYEE